MLGFCAGPCGANGVTAADVGDMGIPPTLPAAKAPAVEGMDGKEGICPKRSHPGTAVLRLILSIPGTIVVSQLGIPLGAGPI